MPRYVALFRGINVGTARRIAMADLRALLAKLKFTEVQTLLNSGNAVFSASSGPVAALAQGIHDAVERKLGIDVLVIVKSATDIRNVIDGNELANIAVDGSRLLVVLTNHRKHLTALTVVAAKDWGDERVHVGKHAAYLWCANGILESKAGAALLKNLESIGTTRNWATLNKIHALMGKVS
jgi:uncharacterized protein (DUF1697 family)